MENASDHKKTRKPTDQVSKNQQQDKERDKGDFHEEDKAFINGIYEEGLVKGTRSIDSSEVRPDKGM